MDFILKSYIFEIWTWLWTSLCNPVVTSLCMTLKEPSTEAETDESLQKRCFYFSSCLFLAVVRTKYERRHAPSYLVNSEQVFSINKSYCIQFQSWVLLLFCKKTGKYQEASLCIIATINFSVFTPFIHIRYSKFTVCYISWLSFCIPPWIRREKNQVRTKFRRSLVASERRFDSTHSHSETCGAMPRRQCVWKVSWQRGRCKNLVSPCMVNLTLTLVHSVSLLPDLSFLQEDETKTYMCAHKYTRTDKTALETKL